VGSMSGAQSVSVFRERVEALETLKELWPQRINKKNHARIYNHVYVPGAFNKSYDELSLSERLRLTIVRRMLYPTLEGTHVQTLVDLFGYYADGLAEEASAFAEGLSGVSGIPILLLNGTADATTPVQMSRELVDLLPQAELVEFEGFTHVGPMMYKKEAKPVFERYVEFVESET
jgi:pimeloyl-ACP methyl ester carboxylesterase